MLLLDTGATGSPDFFPLRTIIDDLIDSWRERNACGGIHYELLVLHRHSHGDHVAGDNQFADRAVTTLISADKETAWRYFGFDGDPDAVVTIDLGQRALDVLATPGHDPSAVTFYDSRRLLCISHDLGFVKCSGPTVVTGSGPT